MIEKFAQLGGTARSEFLDLNHTTEFMIGSVLSIPELAGSRAAGDRRISESGHYA
jgi:hypothetical protein